MLRFYFLIILSLVFYQGNTQTFTSALCGNAGFVVSPCQTNADAKFQSVSVSGLPNVLNGEFGLLTVEIEATIPGKMSVTQPYIDLVDPTGKIHRLFNPQSFPQYNGSTQSFKVKFTACNTTGVKLADQDLPFVEAAEYRPMGNNPLNKVNLSNINPNGTWKLSLCTRDPFTLKCFRLNFGNTCTILNNTGKLLNENCKTFLQVTYADLNVQFCDSQDGDSKPDYYLQIEGNKSSRVFWHNTDYLKMAVPQGKSKIEFGTYFKNTAGTEYTSCVQTFDIDVPNFDTEAPQIQNCPASGTVTLGTDGKTQFNLKHPTFSDNCGIASSSLNIYFLDGATDFGGSVQYNNLTVVPGQDRVYEIKGVGRQVFEFVIKDAAGNTKVCSTVVTALPNPNACANDTQAPFFPFGQCRGNYVILVNSATDIIKFLFRDPFYAENCGKASDVQTLTYTGGATDKDGNVILKYTNAITPGKSYEYTIKGIGSVELKYEVTDNSGNVGTCKTTISTKLWSSCVSDNLPPTLTNCQNNSNVNVTSGFGAFKYTTPLISDNCGIDSTRITVQYIDGAIGYYGETYREFINIGGGVTSNDFYTVSPGRIIFTYFAFDKSGNVSSCSTTFTAIGNYTDPCLSLNPTLAIAGSNCTNNVMSIANAPNAVRIDWKKDNQIVHTSIANATPANQGTTVAGTGVAGNSNTQLNSPTDVEIDIAGNMYVVDYLNNRVLKFAPGSTTGTVLPPKNATNVSTIRVDNIGNIYMLAGSENAVTKWAPGATSGVVVAGGNGAGNSANQLNNPSGFFVDANDNIYVADYNNYRIQKWAPGASSGVTVAGTGVKGSALNQIDTMSNIYVNDLGEIFVAERYKGLVKKFPANSTQGTDGVIVANINGKIARIKLDVAGNIYASGFDNNSDFIKKFPYNSTATTPGIIVAGGNTRGAGANQLNFPYGFSFDASGNILIAEYKNHRISKWNQTNNGLSPSYVPTVAGTYSADVTFTNGCKKTTNSLTIVNCNQNALQFNITNGCISPGQAGTFPITVNNFNGIGAFSFDLVLPPNSNLSFDKVDNLGLSNITYNVLSNGDLRVVWDEPNGGNINLADGTRICDIIIKSTTAFAQPVDVTSREIVLLSNNTVTTAVVSTFTICASSKIAVTGTVKNPAGKPIPKVKLSEYNPTTQSFVRNVESDNNGAYSLGQVTPTNQITSGRNDDPSLGVNIADVARIRRHILQTSLLDNDYKKMAADVDLNGKLDVVDVAITNRIVLKKISVFPNNESWRCVPADYNISANPLDVNIPWWIDLSKPGLNTNNLNFIAVKVGDVDFSASVADEHLENRLAPVTLSIPDTIISPSSNMVVPVYIGGGDKISIFSANLAYDTTKLKLVKIESTMMQGFGSGSYNDLGGNVIIAWDHPQGGEFVGNGTLMKLTFSNKVMTGTSPLTLSNVNAYDIDFNQYTTTIDDGSLTMMPSSTKDHSIISEVHTYPNPFSDVLNMEISLDKADKLKIEIFDALGHHIKTIDTGKISDRHFLQISDLDYKGVLQCKISTSDATFTTKVIKI